MDDNTGLGDNNEEVDEVDDAAHEDPIEEIDDLIREDPVMEFRLSDEEDEDENEKNKDSLLCTHNPF